MPVKDRVAAGFARLTAAINAVNAKIQPTDPLRLTAQTSTPEAGPDEVVLYGRSDAGRILPALVGPSGVYTRLQPHLGGNRVSMWMPAGVSGVVSNQFGGNWVVPTLTGEPMADTEIGRIRKAGASTTATGGNSVGLASEFAYSLNTGFHIIGHFCPFSSGAIASRRFFAGLGQTTLTNSALSGYAGLGVHAEVGHTTLRVRGVNGIASDLGANFPADTATVWYRLELFCPPGGTAVGWKITNVLTGNTASGTFTGAQLPAAGTYHSARCAIVTNAAVAQRMLLGHWMIETDN